MGPFEDPAVFIASGRETLQLAERMAGLRPTHRVLDLGCGCGRLALPMMEFLADGGSYTGLDIDAGCIDWCVKNIAAQDTRFSFTFLDVQSDAYNVGGTVPPEEVRLPWPAHAFDRAVVSSVFTHLREEGIVRYVSELRRVIVPGGSVLASLLLMNDGTRAAMRNGSTSFMFEHRIGDHSWTLDHSQPLEGVSIDEAWFQALARRAGFAIPEVTYGTWRTTRGWTVQHDWLVLHRESGEAA